ncbi:CU044_2847 family protein [Streptomyces europaeiscabiei]|uniref:CU044_2847 family protein n=1 Tax=Streptomyces europaeiscabiei TaxID=146819 RepID=UPI0013C44844|nr:CU044_2847 family protein [Streptomyces europaeiscabiei]MDX2527011.1 CU044_2847 family protein [Streptomyces europaeiscabiei]MDX2757955.1 CU044_2847 family protein [Streptomyces europaeiscabiei]MDX3842389.1 CU044_2847 family protein [Streptomyces europaeiscabiei]
MSEPDNVASPKVLVQVVELESGREISWGSNVAETLRNRLNDIREAIRAGADSVSSSLGDLPRQNGWEVGEVSASFGITLTAEAGVILSKASTEATFEVTVTFRRSE